MEQSGETANLAILDGTEAVFIAQVQCHEMMRTLVKLGSRVPLHASGVGKAIFAALPDEQIDAILKVKGLPRITEHTIVSPETMWAALKVIRQRGYSFDDEEHVIGHALCRSDDLTTSTPSRSARSRSWTTPVTARRAHPAARSAGRAHGGGADAPSRPQGNASAIVAQARSMARRRVATVIAHRNRYEQPVAPESLRDRRGRDRRLVRRRACGRSRGRCRPADFARSRRCWGAMPSPKATVGAGSKSGTAQRRTAASWGRRTS